MKPLLLRIPAFLMLLAFVFLTGCGGGGGGDGGSSNTAPVAVAGSDQDVQIDSNVTLDGSGSSDLENNSLTYTWTQTSGPDVTGGSGTLTGVSPSFTAPYDVSTLIFDLTVNDGNGDSPVNSVQVNVLEHLGPSFYVDADNGDDATGDGSRDNPYATISKALSSIPVVMGGANYDIYVKTASTSYDESAATINIPDGTSLYGGYGDNWVRDVTNNRTVLLGYKVAVHFENIVTDPAWFSGFDLTAADSDGNPPFYSSGVSVDGGASSLYIQDNTITSGNTDASTSRNDSYGLRLAGISTVRVLRNTITAGNAGNSTNAGITRSGRVDGRNGISGGPLVYSSGKGGCEDFTINGCPSIRNSGGPGGQGGARLGGNGEVGKRGWVSTGGSSGSQTGGTGGTGGSGGLGATAGGNGGAGSGGYGGRGGNGGIGNGTISSGFYANNTAENGVSGTHGVGGGGGGGGEGYSTSYGGGGGGGGQGGIAGLGGGAGGSGGASIGILVSGIFTVTIDNNTVTSGNGGSGAAGGFGGNGGAGGDGGFGVTNPGSGADGGDGGGGGMAGAGGQGGAGAGGPSYAIMVGANIAPTISNNSLIVGTGGAPGPDGNDSGGGSYGGRNGDDGGPGGNTRLGGYIPSVYRGLPGTLAQGGWAYGIYDVNPGDGLVPSVNNNSSTPGTAGVRGQAGEQNF